MIQMQHPVTIAPVPAARRRAPVRAGAALGVLLAAALVAPVGAANREHQQLMADIRMLQEQNQQMQLTLAQLGDVLKTITTRLDAQQDTARKAFADQRLVADALAADLRVLREKVDDTNVRLSGLAQELDALRVSIPVQPLSAPAPAEGGTSVPPSGAPGAAPPATGAPAGPETPIPAVAAPATTPAPAAPNPAAGLSPQRLWNQAYADYGAGQWALAIAGFETFLRSFPRSEQADKAQRYIGESYMLDGKFQQAVEAYDRVITTYPTGTEVGLAYYKKGLALVRLGQQDRARDAWQTVVTKYPDSDAAILARQGLDRIAKPPR